MDIRTHEEKIDSFHKKWMESRRNEYSKAWAEVYAVKKGTKEMSDTKTVLNKLIDVLGARDSTHGTKTDSFQRIASYWKVYMEHKIGAPVDLTEQDVAKMMILLKLGRLDGNPSDSDTLIDLAGYAVKLNEMN